MEYSIKAKETIGPRYIKFRSRLEAKWAYIFDWLGWEWEYEPIELNHYIPDFILTNFNKQILVEIKPVLEWNNFKSFSKKIIDSGWKNEYLILGAIIFDYTLGIDLGLLESINGLNQDHAMLIECKNCKSISFNAYYGSYECRKCGIWDGDHHFNYIDKKTTFILNNSEKTNFYHLWAQAQNEVKWTPQSNDIKLKNNKIVKLANTLINDIETEKWDIYVQEEQKQIIPRDIKFYKLQDLDKFEKGIECYCENCNKNLIEMNTECIQIFIEYNFFKTKIIQSCNNIECIKTLLMINL